VLALCAACAPSVDSTGERPNILLFLTDDLGYGDLHAYNPASPLPTPNIDRLAREGLRFTDAHSPSSVCTPTRYAILTGRYAWRTGLGGGVLSYFSEPLIERGRPTLASFLKERGYATAAIGKWHLGLDVQGRGGAGIVRPGGGSLEPDFSAPVAGGPLDYGFDYYFGKAGDRVRAFIEDRSFIGVPKPDGPTGQYEVPGWDEAGAGLVEVGKALEFIDSVLAAKPTRPFFIYYASHSPHGPYASPERIAGRRIAGASGQGPRGDEVLEADAIFGLLLDKLDEAGVARDTLVILTSDNGPARRGGAARDDAPHDPAGGWRGLKGDIWEGGHRVPFIVRWGDGSEAGSVVRRGEESDALIGLNDLLSTFADLVGDLPPADGAEDSESFRAALLDEACDGCLREDLVHQSVAGTFAIREGDWKLVLGKGGGGFWQRGERTTDSVQLYDLARDPGETENVSERHPEIVERLSARLEHYRESGRSARRFETRFAK
jgi:arylsulfatase A-like enzyme